MLVPESLVHFLKPWADFYSHSKAMETVVQSLHIGGLLLGGGMAIAADRTTLRALRAPLADRSRYVAELSTVHRWVLTGLGIVVVSGVALVTADIETFFGSWMYWTKMALVAVLLLNGYWITLAERVLAKEVSESSPHWRTLERTAKTSLALWFTITVFGVALVNLT
ncbi:MAG TPA: DUF6644 family protein [Gemmatimonadaceae bacterium]|jgi:hypothetical protein|nr:DUF6644 family protein [Gemmatimonadaceae bacterium]